MLPAIKGYIDGSNVKLTIGFLAGDSSYEIHMSKGDNVSYGVLANVTDTFYDCGVLEDDMYYFKVKGVTSGLYSPEVFVINLSDITFRKEIETVIYQRLKQSQTVMDLCEEHIEFANPAIPKAYPSIILWLGNINKDNQSQWHEMVGLNIKIFTQDDGTQISDLSQAINVILQNWAYEGKEVAISRVVSTGEGSDTLEDDERTHSLDLQFVIMTERKNYT